MKLLKLISKASLLVLLLSLTGCYYDETSDEISLPPVANVSFANDIQPIFNTSCTSCHNGSQVPNLIAGVSYNVINNGTYIVANNLIASSLYQSLIGNENLMPIGNPLPATKINLVKSWIEQGAKNN